MSKLKCRLLLRESASSGVSISAHQSSFLRTFAERKATLISMMLIGLLLFSGCGRQQLDSTWAGHEYPSKTSSPSGLGYLEKLCLQKGTRFKSVNRLSPRLDRADCLILIGQTFHPPAKEARDWMEDWLGKKSGRRIVYFGRDFDATEYYWERTLTEQPTERQIRAGLDLAKLRATRDDMLYEQMNDDYFCRWFFLRVSEPQRVLQKFSGPWSEKLEGKIEWPVRAYFDAPDQELRDEQPNWLTVPKPGPTFRIPKAFRRGRAPAPPVAAPPKSTNNTGRSVFTSYWIPGDINNAEEWEEEWDSAPDYEELLTGEDGTPLIMRLTSDSYPGSEIITLANGAPLFNGMMIEPDWRELCMHIADEIGEGKRVALLPYSEAGIQVSHVPDIENEIAGLSVLMTWPLNILMAHLAFLGVLLCIALFPILGRPQNLKADSHSDFGQHAEAMGRLFQATRDLPLALQLVTDYLRVVRGESPPAWLESELVTHAVPTLKSQLGSAALPPPTANVPEKPPT